MDITKWDDNYLNWSSADTLRLADMYTVLATIWAALGERLNAPQNIFLAPFSYVSRMSRPADIVYYISNATYTGVNSYANHTINGGDFSGLDEVPHWTRETMAAAIGVDDLLPPPKHLDELRTWCYQQYQIINMCRYCPLVWDANRKDYNWSYNDALSWRTEISATTWTEAVNAFFSTSWTSGRGNWGYTAFQHDDNAQFIIYAAKTAVNFTFVTSIPKNVDVYVYNDKTYAEIWNPDANPYDFFQPLGPVTQVHKLNRYCTITNAAANGNFIYLSDADFAAQPLLAPPAWGGYLITRQNGAFMKSIIAKFDHPNGFKFRGPDW